MENAGKKSVELAMQFLPRSKKWLDTYQLCEYQSCGWIRGEQIILNSLRKLTNVGEFKVSGLPVMIAKSSICTSLTISVIARVMIWPAAT
jgi:hypothetical protein